MGPGRNLGLEVFPLIEVMLIDARGAAKAIWSENQIECLQHCRLSRVVISQQNAMLGEVERGLLDATEIRYFEAANLHWNLSLATRPKTTVPTIICGDGAILSERGSYQRPFSAQTDPFENNSPSKKGEFRSLAEISSCGVRDELRLV